MKGISTSGFFFFNELILNAVQHLKCKVDAIKVTQVNKIAEAWARDFDINEK